MPLNNNTTQRLHTTGMLAVACLVALLAALAPADSEAAKAAKYPKAGVILWTTLAAHSRPSTTAPTIKVFSQFRKDFRPTTLLVVGEREDAKGLRWLKLSMPMRPNGRIGWVKAAAVQVHPCVGALSSTCPHGSFASSNAARRGSPLA